MQNQYSLSEITMPFPGHTTPFFFFGGTGACIQGLTLARQVLPDHAFASTSFPLRVPQASQAQDKALQRFSQQKEHLQDASPQHRLSPHWDPKLMGKPTEVSDQWHRAGIATQDHPMDT
jgi:hypothetical protein